MVSEGGVVVRGLDFLSVAYITLGVHGCGNIQVGISDGVWLAELHLPVCVCLKSWPAR